MKKNIILFFAYFSFSVYGEKLPNVVILDDAEKPRMSRWKVEGPVSTEVGVDYINSEKERRRVIRLRGAELSNEFIFKGNKGQDLNIKGFNVLEWKMKYSVPFLVKVDIETTDGTKYLLYSDMDINKITDDKYLHIGLGSRYRDGNWRTVIRNLETDMNSLLPNVKLKTINSLSFRGTGYLDDIWIMDSTPTDIILENGENDIKGWDRIGKGGLLDIDFDPVLGEIVKFDSAGKGILFRLRKPDKTYWKIKTNVVLQWKIKTTTSAVVYVLGESSHGKYTIAYVNEVKAPYYDEKSGIIYYGLGDFIKDGIWHVFNRNLSDDIRLVRPGVDVSTVGSILVKGAGYIDDIRLLTQVPLDSEGLKGWAVYDSDPSGASIVVLNDVEKGNVAKFSGDGLKNGYKLSIDPTVSTNKKPYLSWDMWFAEPFDIIVAVDTGGLVRYVHYVAMEENYEKIKDGELYLGIGSTKTDGKWYKVTRNIADDIKKLGKDANYLSSNYFMVRGSGKIANINFYEADVSKLKQEVGPSATASMVLGQYDFYRNLKNLWDLDKPQLNSLYMPEDVVADSSGGIYVADTGNNRVLYWDQRPTIYGSPADIEINYGGKLKSPKGLAIIGNDKYLAVADSGNNRVLIFKMPVDETSTPERIISGLKNPTGLSFDGQRFIVSDTGNNRVLVWNSLPKKDDTPFDLVLGQSSVRDVSPNKGEVNPNYNTLMYPESAYSDGNGIYISDTGNNRVLVFEKIPTMNGWHADQVVGQDKFKKRAPNMGGKTSGQSMNLPKGVFINNGLMFVSDAANNRILILSPEDEKVWKTVGVMGQINYSSNVINAPLMIPVPGSLYSPSRMFIKNGIIYVADTANNRVLIY